MIVQTTLALLSNLEMKALNSTEESTIKSAIGSSSLLASTVARLYKAVDGAWEYTKKWGGVVLVKDGVAYYIKVINLEVSFNALCVFSL
jgi:hypothetical protein